jgi:hypothetical protein
MHPERGRVSLPARGPPTERQIYGPESRHSLSVSADLEVDADEASGHELTGAEWRVSNHPDSEVRARGLNHKDDLLPRDVSEQMVEQDGRMQIAHTVERAQKTPRWESPLPRVAEQIPQDRAQLLPCSPRRRGGGRTRGAQVKHEIPLAGSESPLLGNISKHKL